MTIALVFAAALAATPPPGRSISVSGNAQVYVAPDIVQFLLAVETSDKTIAKAKATNDERVKQTLATAAKLGIDAKDTQTDRVTIEPYWDNSPSYGKPRAQPDGYTVKRSIALKLRDVKRFEEVLTAVLDAGTNRVEGIDFQTSELRKNRDNARTMAILAAKEKAGALASQLGMKIGKPSSISESSGYGYSAAMSSRYGAMAQNAVSAGPAGEGSNGFAPGQIAVDATVSVTFDLE
jgi:uncharacterized protein YggE